MQASALLITAMYWKKYYFKINFESAKWNVVKIYNLYRFVFLTVLASVCCIVYDMYYELGC